jgi:hypothetical protein
MSCSPPAYVVMGKDWPQVAQLDPYLDCPYPSLQLVLGPMNSYVALFERSSLHHEVALR